MNSRHPVFLVCAVSIAFLGLGFPATPLWDEDEPRFAAIAETMLTTGDWVVPRYNDTLAVDKPVLMHWCMAACYAVFGVSEFSARLPSVIATLLTALALLRAGTHWFNTPTGVIAALAYIGCLLVGIESHAATPDAILTALCTWATLLVAEAILPLPGRTAPLRISMSRAAVVGGLLGLGVLCKGPIGFVGPLAVLMPWAWSIAVADRMTGRGQTQPTLQSLAADFLPATLRGLTTTRLGIITLAMLAVALPWYVLVGVRTDGAWPAGFFFIHNIGRAAAPMESHSGGIWYHPVTMLVGFYPWSCFLPFSMVLVAWRLFHRTAAAKPVFVNGLLLLWIVVWVTGFSIAATKLPNYVLPAYPAAALLVAAVAVEAASRERWPHPGWLTAGLGWLAFGGIATAAVVIVTTLFGIDDAAPAALVGIVPIAGAIACLWIGRRDRLAAVQAFTVIALVYTTLAVGLVASWLGRANALPRLVQQAHAVAGGKARIGTFTHNTPNIVFYSHGRVEEWQRDDAEAAAAFLESGSDAIVIVPAHRFDMLAESLPEGYGIVGRSRPLFRRHDFLLVGRRPGPATHTASEATLSR
jgi:4-amino-4-deoxy-L-arabinose transferase-like glycosyltransferase